MNLKFLTVFLLVSFFLISPANSKGVGDGSKSNLLRQVDRGTGKHTECSSGASGCISHKFNSSETRRGSYCRDGADCKEGAKNVGITDDVGCAKKDKYGECIFCNISSDFQKAGYIVDGCGLGALVWTILAVVFGMVVGTIISLICCLFCTCCPLYKWRMARRNRQVQPGPPGSRGQGGQGYGYPGGGPGGAGGGQTQMSRPGYPGGPPPPHYTPSPSESQNPGPSPSPSTVVNPKSSTGGETEELSVSELSSTKVPSKKGKKSKSTKKTKSKKGKGKKSPKK